MRSARLVPILLVTAALGCRGRPKEGGPGARAASASAPAVSGSAPAKRLTPPTRGAASQQRLRSLAVFVTASSDELRIDVPPEAQRALRDFKDALLESLDRVLPKIVQHPQPSVALGKAMIEDGYDWAVGNAWNEGAIDGAIEAIPEHRERWAVVLCVLVAPGSDCMLAIYEQRRGRLRQALLVRSDGYASIEGALHALTWKLSPPDAEDRFYVVEAHTHPWPTSRWRDFSYRALAPTETPSQPTVLAEARDSGNWEAGFELDAKENRFSVSFQIPSDQAPDFTAKKTHVWMRHGGRFHPLTPGVKTKR